MWDRLLTDCRVTTMQPAPGNPLGIIENGAIGIQDGRIVRQSAGNRRPLLLAPGQISGKLVGLIGYTQPVQQGKRARAALRGLVRSAEVHR